MTGASCDMKGMFSPNIDGNGCTRQSGPDSGLDFYTNVLETC